MRPARRERRSSGVGLAVAAALFLGACTAPDRAGHRPASPAAVTDVEGVPSVADANVSVVGEVGGDTEVAGEATDQALPSAPVRSVGPSPGPITAQGLLELVAALPAPRDPENPGHRLTQDLLRAKLGALNGRLVEQPFTWAGLPDHDLLNLEWVLPGPDPRAPILIVGAHYDSVRWSPGADDNGSGVAVLLTLARRLSPRRLPCEVRLVFFDAEERGLVGSRHHALSLTPQERERLVGVINLEAVGFADRRKGSQAMPPFTDALFDVGDVGDFALVLANQSSAALADAVSTGMRWGGADGLRVVTYDRLPGVGWLIPDSRRSDHASYWDVGVPAVMVTDTASFRNPHYHRRSDLPATLDGEFLAAVARGVERAVLLLGAEAAGE